jgi:hypothetical protein
VNAGVSGAGKTKGEQGGVFGAAGPEALGALAGVRAFMVGSRVDRMRRGSSGGGIVWTSRARYDLSMTNLYN